MFKCATAVRLCVVHARRPFPVSARASSIGKHLRHLANVRLTCMYYVYRLRLRWNLYYMMNKCMCRYGIEMIANGCMTLCLMKGDVYVDGCMHG